MLSNVADIIGLIFCVYLIIGWITSVMLFVLYLCKNGIKIAKFLLCICSDGLSYM